MNTDLDKIYHRQSEDLRARPYIAVEERMDNLKRLKAQIKGRERDLGAALASDLGKSEFEGFIAEIGYLLNEISHVQKHLPRWARPTSVSTPWYLLPAKSRTYAHPRGQVLVIAPWNYPVQLSLGPLIGAIAAGNRCIIKPSELASATSRAVKELVADTFPAEEACVLEGGPELSQALLQKAWGLVFFTGSTRVGKLVYQAAAATLSPAVLELGGKSPCVVRADADLETAARRIAWGKWMNCGQTCIAPDYVLIERSAEERFLKALAKEIERQFAGSDRAFREYGKIINDAHFDRILGLMKRSSGSVHCGGQHDRSRRFLEPTVLHNIKLGDAIMSEEIFGPVLPVLTFDDPSKIVETIRSIDPTPLAAYYFSADRKAFETFNQGLSFGGGCVNDTNLHLGNLNLSFGGVGTSGLGRYHGRASFATFSHEKSVIHAQTLVENRLRFTPAGGKIALMKKVFR